MGLTPTLSAYLLAVDELVTRHKLTRLRDVAAMRCVRPPSARRALIRLRDFGLVVYRKGEYLDITEAGRTEAARIRGRILEFAKKLSGSGEVAEVEVVALAVLGLDRKERTR